MDLLTEKTSSGAKKTSEHKLDVTAVAGGGLVTDLLKLTCEPVSCADYHVEAGSTVTLIISGIGLEAILPVAALDLVE